jgi:hypothetical protein
MHTLRNFITAIGHGEPEAALAPTNATDSRDEPRNRLTIPCVQCTAFLCRDNNNASDQNE